MFEDADRDAMFVAPEALVVTQEMLGRYPKLSQFCGQYTVGLKWWNKWLLAGLFERSSITIRSGSNFQCKIDTSSAFDWLFSKSLTLVFLSHFQLFMKTRTLAHKLLKLKSIILASTKQQLWGKILANTMSGRGRVGVQINRPRALKAKESNSSFKWYH